MRERRRRRRRGLRALLALVAAAICFAVGVAVGESLDDNPAPGGTTTQIRTLRPLPLPPARETVTVTTP